MPAQNFTGSYEKVCLKKMQSEKLLWFCFFAQEHGCLSSVRCVSVSHTLILQHVSPLITRKFYLS